MRYILKHMDLPLIIFTSEGGANPNINVEWINKEHKDTLPLDMKKIDADSLYNWIKHRLIPRNRAYVNNFLSSMNLSINRPLDIIEVSKGLSLNDCYWIVNENFEGKFEKNNLYDNPFSNVLGEIAFTGYGSGAGRIKSSPEYTTNGMLPKCWRRKSGNVYLYKGATSGFSNSGNEPYAEYYAYQIAKTLGVNAIEYNLSKWKGLVCSTCKLFTSKKYSYVSIGRIVEKGGIEAVRKYYQSLGDKYIKALNEMIIFDAIIFNTDRHYGNFGFLVDNKTNKIVAPAPLFDHGNSLLSLIGLDRLKDEKLVLKYIDTLLPNAYDDFIVEAKKHLDNNTKKKIRKLLEFKFKKHPKYNWDNNRLKMVEAAIHYRAKQLLDN